MRRNIITLIAALLLPLTAAAQLPQDKAVRKGKLKTA